MPLMDRFSDISKVNVCGAARDLLAGTNAGVKGQSMLHKGQSIRRTECKRGGPMDVCRTRTAAAMTTTTILQKHAAQEQEKQRCEMRRATGAESSACVHWSTQ